MKKAALHNLGCKVNAYETEAMQEMLENAGYEIVPFKEGADVYVINTCTVTNIADRKSRQMLHRARKMNPDAIVIAAGCYVQAQADKEEMDPCIDIVLGNNRKKDLISAIDSYEREHEKNQDDGENAKSCVQDCKTSQSSGEIQEGRASGELADVASEREYESLTVTKPGEHTRAYIKVQDGCNQFCTYCIIPYARGRVRSRQMQEVVSEVRGLAHNGYREMVLTGIHLSSYGVDFDGERHLLELIRAVGAVEGIKRVRLGSLEPGIITEEFARELASIPEICPHFHLSLQSGCDETLRRMNRKYTSAEYSEKCEILRTYFDNPALTTDVIVGFPGETEEEFEASRAFVEKIGFYETHIFKYSKREGTKAADMPDQVDDQTKAERSAKMIAIGERNRKAYEASFVGREVEVLVEEEILVDGRRLQTGHTREYMKIALESTDNLKNCIVKVEIEDDSQIVH